MSQTRGNARLDLVVRFAPNEIEIEGSAKALQELAAILRSGPASLVCELLVPADSATPYDGFLPSMRIAMRDGTVQIRRSSDAIEIQGSAEGLATMAQNIEFLVASQSDPHPYQATHIHVEYYPGHFFLDPEAEPLTISVRE